MLRYTGYPIYKDNPVLNSNENELWLPVKDFEDRYAVSNLGRVVSLRNNYSKRTTPKIITQTIRSESCPYYYVKFTKSSKTYNFAVHRLVALMFCPNPYDNNIVNHKNGDKLDNNSDNLEWTTHSGNHKHAYETGLRKPTKSQLGNKWGGSSKFHNVSYDKSRNRWTAVVKENGVELCRKRFVNEVDAALFVDTIIKQHTLQGRALNFP